MARYYFDVTDRNFVADDDGLEFEDVHGASQEALRSLTDLAKDIPSLTGDEKVTVTMRDASGDALYKATLIIQDEWLVRKP